MNTIRKRYLSSGYSGIYRLNYHLFISLLLFMHVVSCAYSQEKHVTLDQTRSSWLYSELVKDSFQILSYLPDPLVTRVDSFPVIFVMDGDMSFGMVYDVVRWLRWGNEIPEVALIGLAYGKGQNGWWQKRSRDYTASTDKSGVWGDWPMAGQAENFKNFLEDELMPFLNGAYGLRSQNRIFVGLSFAGLLGTDILFTRPHLFSKYILAGPAWLWNHREIFRYEPEFAKKWSEFDHVVFTAVGALDDKNITGPWYEMIDRLKSSHYRGLKLHTWVVEGETHLSMFPAALVRGLKTVLSQRD